MVQYRRKKNVKKSVVKRVARKALSMRVPKPVYKGYGAYRRFSKSAAVKTRVRRDEQSIGRKIGGFLGDAAEKALRIGAKYFGLGDYDVVGPMPRQNSLMSELSGNDPAPVVNSTQNGFIIRHREYLQDIITASSSAFNVQAFAINPGLFSSFPWLASIAANFEEYRPRGILFEFKSTSADALNSTNTALGTVIMATEYDSSRGPVVFANKQQMENHEFSASAKQSCSMLHAIECSPDRNPLGIYYVRDAAAPANFDLRNSDLGIFHIATYGQQGASVNIGELWVTYEIEFLKPQLITALGLSLLQDHLVGDTNLSATNNFGTGATHAQIGSNLGCVAVNNTITFPYFIQEGYYLIDCIWTGSSTAAMLSPSFATGSRTNCSLVAIWHGNVDQETLNPNASVTEGVLTAQCVIKVTGPGPTVTINPTAALPTSAFLDIIIMQWNGNILT